MNYFHPRFKKRKNRIGMYCVVVSTVLMFLPLLSVFLPEWTMIVAAILYVAGIALLIIADKE